MMGLQKIRKIVKGVQDTYGKCDRFLYQKGIRKLDTLHLPDFLGIGPPKTGTTWLCENLRCHPKVFVSVEKEVHYFDRNYNRSLKYYSDKFKDGNSKKKGEITPEYYRLSSDRINFIHKIMPNVRLILMLRSPVDRAWSHAIMNFEVAGRSAEDVMEIEFRNAFEAQPLFQLGGYTGIVERWANAFGYEQLYIGLYEDIENLPKKILEEVFDHIGVESDVDWGLFPFKEVIIPPFSSKYKDFDKKRGVRVKGYTNTKHSMPKRHREYLKEMYREDIESLRKNLGIDTSGWL